MGPRGQRDLFPCLGAQREAEVLQGVEEAEEDGKWRVLSAGPGQWQPPNRGPASWGRQACPVLPMKRGGFVSCQATELFDAILEGYPRSKKQFFVSAALPPRLRASVGPVSFSSPSGPQEEVGIETDEDHKVTLPDP